MSITSTLTLASALSFAFSMAIRHQSLSPDVPKRPYISTVIPEKQSFSQDEKRVALLQWSSTVEPTVLADREVSIGCTPIQIHVEKAGSGEPEKTEYYRHLLGDFRKGDQLTPTGGSCVSMGLLAGKTVKYTYDLALFYDLSKPGKYSLYVDFFDDDIISKTSSWVRSNTTHFEIRATK